MFTKLLIFKKYFTPVVALNFKKIFSITMIVVSLWLNVSAADPQPKNKTTMFSGVTKISDDFYVGKVADEFYVAMERVDKSNIDTWLQYAQDQLEPVKEKGTNAFLPGSEGACHFACVLEDYKQGSIKSSNELWAVYASCKKVEKKAVLDDDNKPFIEMYVAVITSPGSLITSYAGISRTWEAACELTKGKRKKQQLQSVHLCSFAAKTIKMRDSNKAYMHISPDLAMRTILCKNLPANSVFIGDNLYQSRVKQEAKINDSRIDLLKSHPPRIIRNDENSKFTLLKPNGEKLVEFDESSGVYQWMFTDSYSVTGPALPHVLVDLDAMAKACSLVH